MVWDAIVLAGGRSSRLDGSPKAELVLPTGETLLERTLAALGEVRRVSVVGPVSVPAHPRLVSVRDEPPFGGPVAGIAAGFDALDPSAGQVIVLACDMPRIAEALPVLRAAAGERAVFARDRGRIQYLAGIHPYEILAAALAAHRSGLRDLSVRRLVAEVETVAVDVPAGSTDDVDTWDDALRFHARAPKEHS